MFLRVLIIVLLSFPFRGACAGGINKTLGKLTPARTCFDVKHYLIHVRVEPDKQYISGSNTIFFKIIRDFNLMQLDYAPDMKIDSIIFMGRHLQYERKGSALLVKFNRTLGSEAALESNLRLKVFFSGKPHVAVNPPWQGGFIWTKDSMGNPWVGLACEGIGASMWLPCKDHWSDEADGMDMFLEVPEGLTGVSNGRMLGEPVSKNGFTTYHWQVQNSINNYNISINVAKYAEIRDTFQSSEMVENGDNLLYKQGHKPVLSLHYFVLEYNKDRAAQHFRQVHKMLRAFEHYFGPYPFYEDGYKLVETSYWGMEHQSCIAYGNKYRNTPYGFDFIIVHESGHEWFANSITADDPADMWIHESFTTYAESLYLEYWQNRDSAQKYLDMQKKKIVAKEPVQGPRDVFYHGHKDADMYYKGTWMLHTMRNIVNNDSLWFAKLRNFYFTFNHRITNSEQVINYFCDAFNYDWHPFFRQYLNVAYIPVLQYKIRKTADGRQVITYQWAKAVRGFTMPLQVYTGNNQYKVIYPSAKPQTLILEPDEYFHIATELFLVSVKS